MKFGIVIESKFAKIESAAANIRLPITRERLFFGQALFLSKGTVANSLYDVTM